MAGNCRCWVPAFSPPVLGGGDESSIPRGSKSRQPLAAALLSVPTMLPLSGKPAALAGMGSRAR